MISGRISVSTAAKVLKMDAQTVRILLRQGNVPWGTAFKKPGSTQFSYLIYAEPFREFTGYREAGDEE